jgi:hypothetical protein
MASARVGLHFFGEDFCQFECCPRLELARELANWSMQSLLRAGDAVFEDTREMRIAFVIDGAGTCLHTMQEVTAIEILK